MNKKLIDWWIGGASVTSEYQAILDRATALGYTHPSAAQKTKQNQLIVDLKAAGIWTLLDTFYVFRTDGDASFALLNWKSPSTFEISRVASCTFTSGQGFNGNGTTMYLNTNFSLLTNGVNAALNSYGIISSVYNNATDSTMLYGTTDAANTLRTSLRVRSATDVAETYMNATFGNLSSAVVTDSSGLWHAQRTASNAYRILRNGVQVSTASDAGGASMAAPNIYLLARNNNGVLANQNSSWKISMFGVGATLSGKESALSTAWTTYIS